MNTYRKNEESGSRVQRQSPQATGRKLPTATDENSETEAVAGGFARKREGTGPRRRWYSRRKVEELLSETEEDQKILGGAVLLRRRKDTVSGEKKESRMNGGNLPRTGGQPELNGKQSPKGSLLPICGGCGLQSFTR